MHILGINFGHDASLALFRDGELIQFEELERASRLKHQFGVTSGQIAGFLARVGLTAGDIELASLCGTQFWALPHSSDIRIAFGIFSEAHRKLFGGDIEFGARNYAPGNGTATDYYQAHLAKQNIESGTVSPCAVELNHSYLCGFDFSGEQLELEFRKLTGMTEPQLRRLQAEFLTPGTIFIGEIELPCFFVDHHFCHANYAHYYSPTAKSIVSTHDGGLPVSPFNSGGIYLGNRFGVTPIVDHRLFLGALYHQLSVYCQVGEPGKLMGLSSYAVADSATLGTVHELLANTGKISNPQEIIDLANRLLDYSSRRSFIRNRQRAKFSFGDRISAAHIQAAANIQSVVEGVFLHTVGAAASLLADIDDDYATLNLTGGFTLNCPTNNSLKQKFQNLAVNPLPGCGDTGLPIGACVATLPFLNLQMMQKPTEELSAAFPPLDFETKFSEADYAGAGLEKLEHPGPISEFIADAIVARKILCLFRGRSEVGPRALGRRSIVAHAIDEEIRDRINRSKGRELWRPLAPICRVDDYYEYFDGDAFDSRYMLFTNRVKQSCLKGITHVDGSARAQAISAQDPWLYPALGRIKSMNQVPVIINTSFNCAGEPIVETIQDAFRSFSKMNFDYLVTEHGVFRRRGSEG